MAVACRQRPRENLLFYEDPDYGFAINGLDKGPRAKAQLGVS